MNSLYNLQNVYKSLEYELDNRQPFFNPDKQFFPEQKNVEKIVSLENYKRRKGIAYGGPLGVEVELSLDAYTTSNQALDKLNPFDMSRSITTYFSLNNPNLNENRYRMCITLKDKRAYVQIDLQNIDAWVEKRGNEITKAVQTALGDLVQSQGFDREKINQGFFDEVNFNQNGFDFCYSRSADSHYIKEGVVNGNA